MHGQSAWYSSLHDWHISRRQAPHTHSTWWPCSSQHKPAGVAIAWPPLHGRRRDRAPDSEGWIDNGFLVWDCLCNKTAGMALWTSNQQSMVCAGHRSSCRGANTQGGTIAKFDPHASTTCACGGGVVAVVATITGGLAHARIIACLWGAGHHDMVCGNAVGPCTDGDRGAIFGR